MTVMNPVGPAVLQTSSNRIATAIEKTEKALQSATSSLLAELAAKLMIEHYEYVVFQETKSLAFAMCLINLEEAQTLYEYLGNTVQQFNKQSVGAKLIVVKTMAELRKQIHT